MIIMDEPRIDTFRGKRILTAHILSSLPGEEGTKELVAFCLRLGMKESWIQHRGEAKEHFDLMGSKCEAAIKAGAVVDKHLLVAIIKSKREVAL